MTDRPIIFSAPMIRALLDGRKTMTRRLLKPQPEQMGQIWHVGNRHGWCLATDEADVTEVALHFVPYWHGDRLYVRESFTTDGVVNGVAYKATDTPPDHVPVKWRPSIHMPRWASRITLTVTDVRVERLQDISEEDAIAEGVEHHPPGRPAEFLFLALWDSLHGPGAWAANPWVAAISFEVERKNIDD